MSYQPNSFRMKKLQFITLLFLILLSACVTTSHKIVKEERNPAWQGSKIDNILVVGAYADRAFRISAESVFADQLRSKGLSVMTSYDIIPKIDELSTEEDAVEFIQKLRENEIEVILSFATLHSREAYDPSAYYEGSGFIYLLGGDSYDADAFGRIVDGEAYLSSGNLELDISLWDAKELTAIWNATTKSYSLDQGAGGVKILADFVYSSLEERGFL